MSIKLRFEKGSLSTAVTLNDDALAPLLEIISKYQADDIIAPSMRPPPPAIALATEEWPSGEQDLNDPTKEQERIIFVRGWLKEHSASEILSKIGWANFPDKILLLGARYEAETRKEGGPPSAWKNSDIDAQFVSAREQPPGNFGRDVSTAIRAGLVSTATQRTYHVTKSGWLKIYSAVIRDARLPKQTLSGA